MRHRNEGPEDTIRSQHQDGFGGESGNDTHTHTHAHAHSPTHVHAKVSRVHGLRLVQSARPCSPIRCPRWIIQQGGRWWYTPLYFRTLVFSAPLLFFIFLLSNLNTHIHANHRFTILTKTFSSELGALHSWCFQNAPASRFMRRLRV